MRNPCSNRLWRIEFYQLHVLLRGFGVSVACVTTLGKLFTPVLCVLAVHCHPGWFRCSSGPGKLFTPMSCVFALQTVVQGGSGAPVGCVSTATTCATDTTTAVTSPTNSTALAVSQNKTLCYCRESAMRPGCSPGPDARPDRLHVWIRS